MKIKWFSFPIALSTLGASVVATSCGNNSSKFDLSGSYDTYYDLINDSSRWNELYGEKSQFEHDKTIADWTKKSMFDPDVVNYARYGEKIAGNPSSFVGFTKNQLIYFVFSYINDQLDASYSSSAKNINFKMNLKLNENKSFSFQFEATFTFRYLGQDKKATIRVYSLQDLNFNSFCWSTDGESKLMFINCSAINHEECVSFDWIIDNETFTERQTYIYFKESDSSGLYSLGTGHISFANFSFPELDSEVKISVKQSIPINYIFQENGSVEYNLNDCLEFGDTKHLTEVKAENVYLIADPKVGQTNFNIKNDSISWTGLENLDTENNTINLPTIRLKLCGKFFYLPDLWISISSPDFAVISYSGPQCYTNAQVKENKVKLDEDFFISERAYFVVYDKGEQLDPLNSEFDIEINSKNTLFEDNIRYRWSAEKSGETYIQTIRCNIDSEDAYENYKVYGDKVKIVITTNLTKSNTFQFDGSVEIL